MKTGAKLYFEPAFLICAVVLAVSGAGKKAVIEITGAKLKKEPIDLQKSLMNIDENLLGPYKVVEKNVIENEDVLESLGTKEYIQWQLEDTEVDKADPTRYCSLFITYYGVPDRIPHVPEECYVGSGSRQLSRDLLTLNIKFPDDSTIGQGVEEAGRKVTKQLDVRHLVFVRSSANIWQTGSKFYRLYVFRVNNDYANSRTGVREILSRNLLGKYSYFSKVEWGFHGSRLNRIIHPEKKDYVVASEKLLSVFLPILETEHWPVWQEISRKE